MKEEEILGILPLYIRTIIKQADINWDDLQEIRLRIQKPVILKYKSKACYLSEQGKITTRKEQLHIVTSQEIRQAMEYISSYSMYAYIEQLKQGFLTIRGGHRVGICGTVVMDHDKVKTIRHISGLNIRVAHESKRMRRRPLFYVYQNGKTHPNLDHLSARLWEDNITSGYDKKNLR